MRAGLVHDRSTRAHRLARADEPQQTERREAARDQHVLGLGLGLGVSATLSLAASAEAELRLLDSPRTPECLARVRVRG